MGPAAREIYILNKIRLWEALESVIPAIAARGNAFQAAVQKIAQRLANEAPLALLRIKRIFWIDKSPVCLSHLMSRRNYT